MKKFLAVISFACYFAAASGVIVNSHYCMKRLVSVHLFGTRAKICGRCGMAMHKGNGCCKDEVKVLKLVQDQNKLPLVTFSLAELKAISLPLNDFLTFASYNINEQLHFQNHSPPLISMQDTYLQNRVFRI
jgi:hypothetical protein